MREAARDVQVSARIPKRHADELQRRAEEADRSFSGELRRAIREYLRSLAPDEQERE